MPARIRAPFRWSLMMMGSGAGRWVNVQPQQGSPITATLNGVTPPGPANLVLNPTPAEQLTAQVNAFICTTATHEYFKSRAPNFTGLDIAIPALDSILFQAVDLPGGRQLAP